MRRLSPQQQGMLRKRVMAAVRDGMSIAEVVGVFAVSRESVRNWMEGALRPRRRCGLVVEDTGPAGR